MGHVTRDIERKVSGNTEFEKQVALLLEMGRRLLRQKRTNSNKLHSLHAPEAECISKGKVYKRYEFGCKVSIATI